MTSSKHDKFIQLCYTLAEEAVGNGDHPFGALLVRDCAVLQTAVNTVHSDNDETRHAEINLVSEAGRQFGPETLAAVLDFQHNRGMAEDGIVGTYAGSQAREVLISPEDWEKMQGLPGGGDAGSVVVFSGADGTVLRKLTDPGGAANDELGLALDAGDGFLSH